MSIPKTLPAPRRNQTDAGAATRFDDLVAADFVLAAVGDYTGGAAEDIFTLASHGLSTGDVIYCVGQTAKGVVTGGVATRFVALVDSSSVFRLTSDGTTVVENSADGTAHFLRGNGVPQRVADAICYRIIMGGNDTTGGTVEDMNFVQSGAALLEDGDTIKLLYKSAGGAAAVAADASAYVKSPVNTISATAVTSYFQTAATSGGSVLDTTADGTNVWIKTS